VKRFNFDAVGAPAVPTTDIPTSQLSDPAGIGFRSPTDLFVGNRHGNVLGQGSVARFTVSSTGSTITPNGSITAPGMVGVHDIDFSPTTGDLFAATLGGGIYRFTFDGSGNPAFAGAFGQNVSMRGVAVHPNGRFVYTTAASNQIRVYRIDEFGGVFQQPSILPPGASNLHFFAVHPDGVQLYLGDIGSNLVYRFRMGSGGELVQLPAIPSPAAIDIAFSPNAQEMFVGNHFQGGITRYQFDAAIDNWVMSGFIATPSMGAFAVSTPRARPCFQDFNGDGIINPDDLADYIACFFNPPCGGADYNADGIINPDDLSDYITDYFGVCG
jgi:DNA-binding beta-propeller fold protein YncE